MDLLTEIRPLTKNEWLSGKVQFCLDAEIDTLDLRKADAEIISEFLALTRNFHEVQTNTSPSTYHDPTAHPVFVSKLSELIELLSTQCINTVDV